MQTRKFIVDLLNTSTLINYKLDYKTTKLHIHFITKVAGVPNCHIIIDIGCRSTIPNCYKTFTILFLQEQLAWSYCLPQ